MVKQDSPVTAADDNSNGYEGKAKNLFNGDSYTKRQMCWFTVGVFFIVVFYIFVIAANYLAPSFHGAIIWFAKALAALLAALAAFEDWKKNRVKDELERYEDSDQQGIKQSEYYKEEMNNIQLRKGVFIVTALATALLSIS